MNTAEIIEDKVISEDHYDNMLGAMPPIWITNLDGIPLKGAFALGEPYNHVKLGDIYKAVFLAFYEKDGKYYEVGNKVYFNAKGEAARANEEDLLKYNIGGTVLVEKDRFEKGGLLDNVWSFLNKKVTFECFTK